MKKKKDIAPEQQVLPPRAGRLSIHVGPPPMRGGSPPPRAGRLSIHVGPPPAPGQK